MTDTTTTPTTTTPKTRTITLTGRPPVTIREDDWPILAQASYDDWEGQFEFQASRIWKGRLLVRQHEDGRAIVYGVYTYFTAHQSERDDARRGGVLLPATPTTAEIIAAIYAVHHGMDIDSEQWMRLADECIADLPPEVL